jgi:hypothetical protein
MQFGDGEQIQFHLLGREAEWSIIAEVFFPILIKQFFDEGVALGISPRVAEGKEVFGLIGEGMFKGEFKAFLALRYSILLQRGLDSPPFSFLLTFKDR